MPESISSRKLISQYDAYVTGWLISMHVQSLLWPQIRAYVLIFASALELQIGALLAYVGTSGLPRHGKIDILRPSNA